jgi:hypothetical protein
VEVKGKGRNVVIQTCAWKRDQPTLVYRLAFLDDETCGMSSKTQYGVREGLLES